VYTKCKAELKVLERTQEFVKSQFDIHVQGAAKRHDGYAAGVDPSVTFGLLPEDVRLGIRDAQEGLRTYLCQTRKLIDRADYFLERVGTLKSIVSAFVLLFL
jgi:hypothetical protein